MKNEFSFTMKDVKRDHEFHNVGQCLWITSVNRQTGEVTMTYNHPQYWTPEDIIRETEAINNEK